MKMLAQLLGSVTLCSSLMTLPLVANALPQGAIPEDVRQIMTSIMTVNYGSTYDKLRGCWVYAGASEQYCMTPIRYDMREVNNVNTLFVLVSGDTVGEGARVTPGLAGLFTAYKQSGAWIISASEPYIYNGGAGRSQFDRFEFGAVGDYKYGWYGEKCSSGAGGHTGCIWELYVPLSDGHIKQVADISYTTYYESLTHGNYYKAENYVSFDYSAPQVGGYYPIKTLLSSVTGFLNDDLDSKNLKKSKDQSLYHYNQTSQKFEQVK